MRPSNERHPGSERGLQRVCAPLRSVSSGAKLEQVRRIPGSSVSIGMLCRNFACWLPNIGLLLRIFHATRTENAPNGYERLGAASENAPHGYARKKRNPRQMMASCSPKLRSDPTFSIALFSPLGPRTGSGAVPRTPALPGYCRGIAGT